MAQDIGNLRVEITGIKELQAAFLQSPTIATTEINTAIKKSILLMKTAATKYAPVDLGFLRNSGMVSEFSNMKGVLKNTAPYAIYVHDGTLPHWPNITAITPWAERHGIVPFVLARSIADKGTKANPFFKKAIDESNTQVQNSFTVALANIVNKLSE